MIRICLCLILAFAAMRSVAEGLPDTALDDLCGDGTSEGRYSTNFAALGPVSLYIVCVGTSRISASWIMGKDYVIPVNLAYVALDGDKLTFTSFKTDPEESLEIPSTLKPGIRLEVSFAKLKGGELEGVYKTTLKGKPIKFKSKRDQTFPNLLVTADHAQDFLDFSGTFLIENPKFGAVHLHSPAYLDLSVIAGTQRVAVMDSGGLNFAMYVGMVAKGAGNVFYASCGVAEDADNALLPLIHVRGRLLSADVMEFYYFNAQYGMSGPYRAHRI